MATKVAAVVYGLSKVQICYIDEAGDTAAISNPVRPNDQPVLVIGALIVDAARLESITNEFVSLKYTFFPGLNYGSTRHLDKILPEVKGSGLRKDALLGNRNERRHSIGFLGKVLDLLHEHDTKLVARIWVKCSGQPFDGRAVYSSSIQSICSTFDWLLASRGEQGMAILDSRTKGLNVQVAHSIFTQKFQASTSFYSGLVELPTFGHSDNHAGLQLCDIVTSGLISPIAAQTYCEGTIANVHVQPAASTLKIQFAERLKRLQYRYKEPSGRWKGGLTVSDRIGGKSSTEMFRIDSPERSDASIAPDPSGTPVDVSQE